MAHSPTLGEEGSRCSQLTFRGWRVRGPPKVHTARGLYFFSSRPPVAPWQRWPRFTWPPHVQGPSSLLRLRRAAAPVRSILSQSNRAPIGPGPPHQRHNRPFHSRNKTRTQLFIGRAQQHEALSVRLDGASGNRLFRPSHQFARLIPQLQRLQPSLWIVSDDFLPKISRAD